MRRRIGQVRVRAGDWTKCDPTRSRNPAALLGLHFCRCFELGTEVGAGVHRRIYLAKRRVHDGQKAQAKMFEAVLDQRALVDQANAKTKAARRSVQRRNDAVNATIGKAKTARGAVDYSKPVKPAESELWDD